MPKYMLQTESQKLRIDVLDSFRFIAITMVVLYHFMVRWTVPHSENYYPFGAKFVNVPILRNGQLGVNFFFIISGFVIFYTLERTKKIKIFILNRLSRLWPTMLLCSVITFFAIKIIDQNNSMPVFETNVGSFLPSLTFLNVWKFGFMDGAYWSLEVEVKFYFICSVIYFLAKKNFLNYWLLFVIIVLVLNEIINFDFNHYFNKLFFPQYLMFFNLGIMYFKLYSNNKNYKIWSILALSIFYVLYKAGNIEELLILIVFNGLFILFVLKKEIFNFLQNKFVTAVGLSSYPLYLLHQNIGVVLMARLGKYFSGSVFGSILLVGFLYLFFCIVGILIYQKFEMNISRKLKFFINNRLK